MGLMGMLVMTGWLCGTGKMHETGKSQAFYHVFGNHFLLLGSFGNHWRMKTTFFSDEIRQDKFSLADYLAGYLLK
jgi:hypothetical protein